MKASEFISKLANTIEKNGDFDIDIVTNNHGNEFVDLGLPSGLLWAKCNYGANKETESGGYYSWGEAMKLPIQLPTKEQIEELIEHTVTIWIKNYKASGISGRLIISMVNGNYIFIPASGYTNNDGVYGRGSDGYVWSSTLNYSYYKNSWCLGFYGIIIDVNNKDRYYGLSVRGVVSTK